MPVTAGKKTARTKKKPFGSTAGIVAGSGRPAGVPPRKNETSESAIAPMMKNCALSARFAEKTERRPSAASVAVATTRASHAAAAGNAPWSASTKPAV